MAAFLIPMLLVVVAGIIAVLTGIATPLLEIAAGIFAANILGFESTEIINFLGEIGIIALMYLAGLEINIDFIKKEYKKSLGLGAISFFTPFITIILVGKYLLGLTFLQAVIAGISLSATSVAIVYPILLQRGKFNNEKRALLSAAMITDILGVVMLSIFFSETSMYTILFLVALIALAKPIRKIGAFFLRKLERKKSIGLKLKVVLLVLLGIEVIAPFAGIEAVLIAFLFGILTSELVNDFEQIEIDLKSITFAFLTPFFFFTVGLSIDALQIASSLKYLIPFTLVGYIAHFAGTSIPAQYLLKKNAKFAGHLFNSKLSIGIIATTLGLSTGVLTPEIYIALVGALILCTFVSSVATHEKFTLEG
jgi:glutathione-regulated potassium-efflux system ancillary protein KefC